MKRYAIDAEVAVEADVEAAFDWYEFEEPGLGFEFLQELRATYQRILNEPFGYQELRLEYVGRSRGDFPMPSISLSKKKSLLSLRFFTQHALRPSGNGETSGLLPEI